MRKLLLIIMLFCLYQAVASANCEQPKVNVSTDINCREMLNIFGKKELEILSIQAQSRIIQNCENDEILIDLSDGDQIEEILFKKEEMAKLYADDIKTIRGVRKIGYWYADGDHITNLVVIQCSKK